MDTTIATVGLCSAGCLGAEETEGPFRQEVLVCPMVPVCLVGADRGVVWYWLPVLPAVPVLL